VGGGGLGGGWGNHLPLHRIRKKKGELAQTKKSVFYRGEKKKYFSYNWRTQKREGDLSILEGGRRLHEGKGGEAFTLSEKGVIPLHLVRY